MKLKEKIKSYSFWTSLSAALIILIQNLGDIFGFKIEQEIVNNIIMSICGVLVVVGVVSMPVKQETNKIDNEKE